jgi:transposase InsO family protein
MIGVDKSGYYKWLKTGKSKRKESNEILLVLIKREYFRSKCFYGSPRITAILKKDNVACPDQGLQSFLRQNGLFSKIKRKYKATTYSRHKYAISKNLLDQKLTISKPNEVWVSDITYIPTKEGFIYLTTVKERWL